MDWGDSPALSFTKRGREDGVLNQATGKAIDRRRRGGLFFCFKPLSGKIRVLSGSVVGFDFFDVDGDEAKPGGDT